MALANNWQYDYVNYSDKRDYVMGFFDSIKNALGGKDNKDETVKGPSLVLTEAGIDPSGMDFKFGTDGKVTITGQVKDQALSDKVGEVVAGIPQVSAVENQLVVGAPEVTEPEPEVTPEPAAEPSTPTESAEVAAEPAAEPEAEKDAEEEATEAGTEAPLETYTVQSGDSLWKIAEAHYGNGNKYHAIFDANRDILDNPDLIKPGQVLKLPEA